MTQLYVTPPGTKHLFPHRRIVSKVLTAKAPYPCDLHPAERSEDCRPIERGDPYVRVSLRPQRGAHGWRTVRCCEPCAVRLRLATYSGPFAS